MDAKKIIGNKVASIPAIPQWLCVGGGFVCVTLHSTTFEISILTHDFFFSSNLKPVNLWINPSTWRLSVTVLPVINCSLPGEFILSAKLQDVSVIVETFQYSNTPAGGSDWFKLRCCFASSLNKWVGVPVRRGFMTLSPDRSPLVGLKQPSVHRGCLAFLPASLWLCWSGPCARPQWGSGWTYSKPHVHLARMDLPGYLPVSQQSHPPVHHPGNQPEDLLTLERSSTCEYKTESCPCSHVSDTCFFIGLMQCSRCLVLKVREQCLPVFITK